MGNVVFVKENMDIDILEKSPGQRRKIGYLSYIQTIPRQRLERQRMKNAQVVVFNCLKLLNRLHNPRTAILVRTCVRVSILPTKSSLHCICHAFVEKTRKHTTHFIPFLKLSGFNFCSLYN